MASSDYLVTAGDIYSMVYIVGTTSYSYNITVDSSYKIRVANLAIVDASGKSFLELKSMVESVVTRNYPLSGVQFVLSTPATFAVVTRGEVTSTAHTSVWALTRLSEVVSSLVTSYSSIRDISITSANGTTKTYDLFKAQRFGDLKEDPYLRPGDIINVKRLSRSVKLAGAVERAGTYQLLPGENLSDLIKKYGSGFTPVADPSRIELVRYVDSKAKAGDKVFLGEADVTANYALENFDTVTVLERTDLKPVLFVEGAIGSKTANSPEVSTRVSLRFNEGENYASVVRANASSWFTSISDTASAYIIRGDTQLPINLNPILYDSAYQASYTVENNDVLVVPFRQYFVTVAGAVVAAGRYPYIPGRDWSYYIGLAGGFNIDNNAFDAVTITDIHGKRQRKTDPITPECKIFADNNAFLYYFDKWAPVITTTATIITSVFAVKALLQQ
jgi:protein involved in polysaccharide export with SLBB domain